ncbi:MAG: hypothetical protein KJ718_02205 [Nanoarchaeota archaeon]|nr:hypothetical protein [Nanoarchaeota archaeon]MBU1051347.1 hypothetical protein [Nanoarchaeota archaeon]MBU1987947.1 hypothetical protein [Nanoarchaeota archaeon]
MEENIFRTLREIGLTKNETVVYLDLLTQKSSSAGDITKRTKLHKANTYAALQGLSEKGFIATILQEEKRLFRAQNPNSMVDYVRQKEKELLKIIPTLRTIERQDSTDDNEVSMVNGILASRNALFSILRFNKPLAIYGMPSTIYDVLGEGFFQDFHKQRVRKKIPMKLIFNENQDEISSLNKLDLTEARYSELIGSFAPTILCDNTIIMLVLTKPVSAIEIKNRSIADGYRGHFEILWKHAKQRKVV